ncbi:hypothetical protein, partial [Polynucleobacter sphagniphilus]
MRITANQKQEIANATLVKLDALANRRQVWQRDFFDKSNKGLYALLSECLGMYCVFQASVTTHFRQMTGHFRVSVTTCFRISVTA